jgi:radical SAM superfamily enzyme YgiQ (UPF0313 family)
MTRPYRVLLVAPISEGFQGEQSLYILPFLSLPTLAAYMPPGTTVDLVHERYRKVDLSADVDLVALTVMTPCAPRAYVIADAFKKRGITVVMGGVHATVMPDEALQHCDAICIGEGEQIWPQMVQDAMAGRLLRIYKNPAMYSRGLSLRAARRDLLPVGQYFGGMFRVLFMETTRGCPYDCDFCSVTTFFGQQYRTRSVDEIQAEIEAEGVKRLKPGQKRGFLHYLLCFTDDNFFGNVKHAAAVMEMLRHYDVRWISQTTLRVTDHPDLMGLCRESGCLGFEIGFESLEDKKYRKTGSERGQDQRTYFLERVRALHQHGIGINGSFMFGNEEDDLDTFARYVDFIEEARIQTPYLTIRTPYPGTPIYYQMKEDGRLLHEEWEKYDTAHAVFRPRNMTAEQLEAGYRWAWRRVTRHSSMLRRNLFIRGPLFRFWGPAALGFRVSTRKEHSGKERRHPSLLKGLDGPLLLPPPRENQEMPAHIVELRARPKRELRAAAEAGGNGTGNGHAHEHEHEHAHGPAPAANAGRKLPIVAAGPPGQAVSP